MNKKNLISVIVIIVLLSLPGYLLAFDSDRNAGKKDNNKLIKIVLNNKHVIEDDGKKIEFKWYDKLPAGFPKDFPVYPNSEVLAGADMKKMSIQPTALSGTVTSLKTKDNIRIVKRWYESELETRGWDVVSSGEPPSPDYS